MLTHAGRTQTLKRWARELGMSHVTLRYRIRVLGWSVKEALTKPVNGAMDGSSGRAGAKERRTALTDEALS